MSQTTWAAYPTVRGCLNPPSSSCPLGTPPPRHLGPEGGLGHSMRQPGSGGHGTQTPPPGPLSPADAGVVHLAMSSKRQIHEQEIEEGTFQMHVP